MPSLQNDVRDAQNVALRQLVNGKPLEDVLTTLVLNIEHQSGGMLGSILLLLHEDAPRLYCGAAPSLPPEYNAVVEGFRAGPVAGSCGTAAHFKKRIVVENIATDPLWAQIRREALKHGLQACWSQPIVNSTGDVLGTFALYYHKPRRPTDDELGLIDSFADIAALAIERKRAEEALRKSERHNRALIEHAPYCIHQIDLNGRLISMNAAGLQMMDVADEKRIVGMRYLDVVSQNDRPRIQALLDAAMQGEASEFEFRSTDGTMFASSFIPIFDDDRQVNRLMGLTQDITERRRVEEERLVLESQLRQSHKMEAVGQLAGGVAHDFNNLLTAILGNAETLLRTLEQSGQPDLTEKFESGIKEIQLAGNHAATLTRQLLAFSRREILRPELIDPRVALREMNALLSRLVSEQIELDVLIGDQVSMIHADSGQLEQIVMNLVVNGADAMPNGGPLQIKLEDMELYGRPVPGFEDAVPGRYVQLSVTDRGTGMSPETIERMFEPFFTTKPVGKGTGLGLSMVYGIVKQSKGFIQVESSVGTGTTFRVCFPAIDHGETLETSMTPTEKKRSEASILICEDESMVRSVMCKALAAAGYSVIESEDGRSALEAALQHDSPIELLITDVVMPGLNGSELAEKLVEIHPNVRVLFVSGYSADHLDVRGIECGATQLLQKPFGPSTLVERVRSMIDGDVAET